MADLKFCEARFHAESLAASASAGYWDDARADYHRSNCEAALRQIAEALGFVIVSASPPPRTGAAPQPLVILPVYGEVAS